MRLSRVFLFVWLCFFGVFVWLVGWFCVCVFVFVAVSCVFCCCCLLLVMFWLFFSLKMESHGLSCFVVLLSTHSLWEWIFCSSGWVSLVHLWRDCSHVKSSTEDHHLLTQFWSSLTRQQCPPLSPRINLTSSVWLSFYNMLGTCSQEISLWKCSWGFGYLVWQGC